MKNRRGEDCRTTFQNVVLTADNVLIFLKNLRHLGFLSLLGFIPENRSSKGYCLFSRVRSLGLYKFCLEAHLVLYP